MLNKKKKRRSFNILCLGIGPEVGPSPSPHMDPTHPHMHFSRFSSITSLYLPRYPPPPPPHTHTHGALHKVVIMQFCIVRRNIFCLCLLVLTVQQKDGCWVTHLVSLDFEDGGKNYKEDICCIGNEIGITVNDEGSLLLMLLMDGAAFRSLRPFLSHNLSGLLLTFAPVNCSMRLVKNCPFQRW